MSPSIAPKLKLSVVPATKPAVPVQPFAPAQVLEPGWTQIRNADEALRFLNRAADRDPRQYPVGVTLSSPATAGRELACWFESWTQVWMALRYVAVHLSGKQGDDLKTLTRSLSQLRLSYGSDDLQVARLQRMFGIQLRVLRMGTFQDLCSGVGSYSRALMEGYQGDNAPVASHQLEGFITFLRKRAFH